MARGAEFSTPPDSCGDCERYVDAYRDAIEARVRGDQQGDAEADG